MYTCYLESFLVLGRIELIIKGCDIYVNQVSLLVQPPKSIFLQLRFYLLSVTPYFKIKAFLIHSLSGIFLTQKCQYFHSAVHTPEGIAVVVTHGNLNEGLTSIVPGTVCTQNKSWFPLQVFKFVKCFGLKSFEWI